MAFSAFNVSLKLLTYSFQDNVPILYYLKTPENHCQQKIETLGRNELKLESQTMFKWIKKTEMQCSNLFDVTELTMLTMKDIDLRLF